MKRFWKIFGISLGSLIGFCLLIIFLVCYVVFTPKQLTPITRRVADKIITCPHNIGEVNLTFFRTFPSFGVQIEGVYIINPTDGAPSDTVLAVPHLIVGLDLIKAIDGDIEINCLNLNDIEANIFINNTGETNFDVLSIPESETKEDTDTGGWELRSIKYLDNLTINTNHIRFVDLQDSIQASLYQLNIVLSSDGDKAFEANIEAPIVACQFKDLLQYDSLSLNLHLPIEMVDTSHVQINDAQIALNEFAIGINGTIGNIWSSPMAYNCDVNVQTNDWQISSLLRILPKQYLDLIPKGIVVDGKIQLTAQAYGLLDSIQMPLVEAQLKLKEIEGHYDMAVLPYYINEANADIIAHVDLNEKQNTTATINALNLRSGETQIALSGRATDILAAADSFVVDNPLCKLAVDLNVNLADADYWLPKDSLTSSYAKGKLMGKVDIETRLNDVIKLNPNKIKMAGNLDIADLDFLLEDSITAQADKMNLHFIAPKKGIADKNIFSANCTIDFTALKAHMENLLLNADIASGSLNGGFEFDTKDTTCLPTLEAGFSVSNLKAIMDTIQAHATNTKGQLLLTNSRFKKTVPCMKLTFESEALEANMGKELAIDTKHIGIEANAHYNKKAKNILLKWNPRLDFDLRTAHINMRQLGTTVSIPQIKFNYNNKECHIDTSRIMVGQSDFCLSGDFTGLGKWLRQDGDLKGQMLFTSTETNVDELLEIFNRLSPAQPDSSVQTNQIDTPDTTAKPLMIPDHVILDMAIHIERADVMGQTATNLKGLIHIRQKQLILEEVGFICRAAKLQLTAMYKTPRENHLFLGCDFHMVDIDIAELINMIPAIDTMMPMLSSFQGKAQFHLALESYFNNKYQLKTSTTRGACSIEGQNLVVLDGETFKTIATLLMFSPKTKNIVDSLSVEATLYKNQIDIYPFCLSIDHYMAALGGRHTLDNHLDYHVSLLRPFYLGVDVKGTLDDMDIHLAKCRYAEYFKPILRHDVNTQNANLRQMIRDALHASNKLNNTEPATNNEK